MTDIAGILSYISGFAIMAVIYAILTLGLNVHWGYTGLLISVLLASSLLEPIHRHCSPQPLLTLSFLKITYLVETYQRF